MADALEGFEPARFTAEGTTRAVYRTGSGPAVIVISELPGITPQVADFGRTVAAAGLTAVLPHLFGHDGRRPVGRLHRVVARPGLHLEGVHRPGAGQDQPRSSPGCGPWPGTSTRRCGGPGVGAVGMCFTGGFALGMMVDDVVVAPVLSQPSLPFPLSQDAAAAISGSPTPTSPGCVERAAAGTCVLGLRFSGDRASPPERFEHLRELLGDGFVGVELDSSPGNPYGHRKMAHSVLTEDLDDRPGTPTRAALDQVLAFFTERLLG